MGDVRRDPRAWEIAKALIPKDLFGNEEEGSAASEAITEEMNEAMSRYMPLRGSVSFGGGKVSMADVQALVNTLNNLEDE